MANFSNFRSINFTLMLYETLTKFFSLNKVGNASWLYKFCAACVQPLQQPFADFVTFRNKEYLIAQCKFTIGQLTNVLNYLYDPVQNRINITQSIANPVYAMQFAYKPILFASRFGTPALIFARGFTDRTGQTTAKINVPAGIDLSDLTATVAQIDITGIDYQIVTV